jgi:HlyD family secretion protein
MVHESYLKKISVGMPTLITVDALQGKKYYGTIQQIAPLPDARSMWMNPDLKLYTTKVSIDSEDLTLRSGMSCQAEIIVEQHKEAIYVPLQAVIRVGNEPTVYVKNCKNLCENRKTRIGQQQSNSQTRRLERRRCRAAKSAAKGRDSLYKN